MQSVSWLVKELGGSEGSIQNYIGRLDQPRLNQHARRKWTQLDFGMRNEPHGHAVRTDRAPQTLGIQMIMETGHCISHPVFPAHVSPDLLCLLARLRLQCHLDRLDQPLHVQLLIRHRLWTGARSRHDRAPERLVAEKRHDDRRSAQEEPCGRGSCAAVVHDGRDVLEEPVVRTLSEQENVFWRIVAADVAPAFGDQGALAGFAHGIEDDLCEFAGVVDYDGSESDVDGRRAGGEEVGQVVGGLVVRFMREGAESADVDAVGPVGGFG